MQIIIKNLLIKIATCGGLGNFHLAPGTLTSLIAALIGYIININFGFEYTFYLLLILLPIGWYASEYYSRLYNKKDPKEVVIDEFIGQLIVSIVANKSILLHVIGFIFFSLVRSLGDQFIIDDNLVFYWEKLIDLIKTSSKYCILLAMVSLGLQTNIKELTQLGYKPLIIGFVASISIGIISIIFLKYFV